MPAFFFKFTIMSWSIPAQVEKDIIAGKATYRTFQTGMGGQSILPVPANSYAVIFGYDFSPAGGGIKKMFISKFSLFNRAVTVLNDAVIRWFETQQLSFYTGTDFYPFIHHVDVKSTALAFQVFTNNPVPESNNVLSNQILKKLIIPLFPARYILQVQTTWR
jgi:hypothetical protein